MHVILFVNERNVLKIFYGFDGMMMYAMHFQKMFVRRNTLRRSMK